MCMPQATGVSGALSITQQYSALAKLWYPYQVTVNPQLSPLPMIRPPISQLLPRELYS